MRNDRLESKCIDFLQQACNTSTVLSGFTNKTSTASTISSLNKIYHFSNSFQLGRVMIVGRHQIWDARCSSIAIWVHGSCLVKMKPFWTTFQIFSPQCPLVKRSVTSNCKFQFYPSPKNQS